MNNNKGFTLIELVIVIVILGILAATAAPKFIDLTGDARESVMEGLEGSIQSAVEIAHAKALIEGQTGATGEIQVGSTFYALVNGWPAAEDVGDGTTTGNGLGIQGLLEVDLTADTGDFEILGTPSDTVIEFTHQDASTDTLCKVTYDLTDSDVETRPSVTTDLTGC